MNIDKGVMLFAGLVVMASVALSVVHSIYWLGLTAFIGLNLFQASLTGFCPLAKILKKAGMKPGQAFK